MKKVFSLGFFILILISVVYSQKENKFIRGGNKLYNGDKFNDAEIEYRKSIEADNESYKGRFNLADAMYKQENYEEAIKLFENLASMDVNAEDRAEAYHNLGNSLFQTQKFEESINAYKNALRQNPDDFDTKYNMELAKKMLKQQQQQQQQQQDQDQDKDKKDDQEKNEEQQQQDKKDQQDQQDKKEQQQQQDQEKNQEQQQQQQQQMQEKQISKEDAERMLEALKNDEQKTLEKLKKQKLQKARGRKTEKDW